MADYLWLLVFVIAFTVTGIRGHIDFDDIESIWLKNVSVMRLPVANDQRQILLKITGLPAIDSEDDIQIKPTFSATECIGNESNLQIINDLPSANTINRTIDLIIALGDFNFRSQTEAYLCIKTKYETFFQHMGIKSKIEK